MKKKLQIFVSTTYLDLREERQSVVEAILNAGHIPAGMELFKAGSEAQKNTIQRWIDESDAYLFVLGGRYGSIEPITKKSYIHWEYDYAGQAGKPRFVIVISDEVLRKKGQENLDFIEREHYAEYKAFKEEVLKNMSDSIFDSKDIKLAIHDALSEIGESNLASWVSGNNTPNVKGLEKQLSVLKLENEQLKLSINGIQSRKPVIGYSPPTSSSMFKGNYLRFLMKFYKVTGGRKNSIVNMYELGQKIGFSDDESFKVTQFLVDEGLVKFAFLGKEIAIIHEGIVFIEDIVGHVGDITDLENHILVNLKDGLHISLFDLTLKFPHLESYSEVAFYVSRLQQKGLIVFDGDPFVKDGRMNQRFKNNVIRIMFEKVRLSDKGNIIVEFNNI